MPTTRPCISQLENNKFRLNVTFKRQKAKPRFDTFNEARSELDRCAISVSEASKPICRLTSFHCSFYYAIGKIGKVWVPLSTEAKKQLDVIGVKGLFEEWRDTAVKKKIKKKSSIYHGVSWYSRNQKWQARYKQKFLGYFQDEEDAALAYDRAALTSEGE